MGRYYQYSEAHESARVEGWLSDAYVAASSLSLVGSLVVVGVLSVEGVSAQQQQSSSAARLSILCLAVSDALFALVVIAWRILSEGPGTLHCAVTQPVSVAVETWSILWSAAVALSLGLALRTRDERSARTVAAAASIAVWPTGVAVAGALAFARDTALESMATCQYRRGSSSYVIELFAQLAAWIVVCVFNALAVAASSLSLRNAPGRVADRHLGRLSRFSAVGVSLWGCRMVADLSRRFPGPYNVFAVLWIMPGLQGLLNALALGTGPLSRSFKRLFCSSSSSSATTSSTSSSRRHSHHQRRGSSSSSSSHGRRRRRTSQEQAAASPTARRSSSRRWRRPPPQERAASEDYRALPASQQDETSPALPPPPPPIEQQSSDNGSVSEDGESRGSCRTRHQDSLVRHLCFNESNNSVRVAVRYPGEEEHLQEIADAEQQYLEAQVEDWLIKNARQDTTAAQAPPGSTPRAARESRVPYDQLHDDSDDDEPQSPATSPGLGGPPAGAEFV